MALPSDGSISLGQARTEAGASGAFSLGSTAARNMAGVANGQISMSQLRGKSSMSATAYGGSDTGDSFGNPYTAKASGSLFVSGGSGTYTYQWYVSSGSALDTASVTTQYPSISMQVRYGGRKSCQCYCVVTDSNGNSVTTNTVTLSIAYTYNGEVV